MNKIRDLIYNTSDILVTVLIILAALVLISWRVNKIMDYGTDEAASAESGQSIVVVQTDISDTAASSDGTADTDKKDTDANTAADASDKTSDETSDTRSGSSAAAKNSSGTMPSEFKITVRPNETSEEIVSNLYNEGLISDKDAFRSSIKTMNAETKLKAGTYTIPAGSSPEDIINILIS